MDISKATKEQKVSAAVAYLSKNMGEAPEESKKHLLKLNDVNNEGMNLVRQINELKSQIESIDAEIGQKIGAAKVLFEIIGEQLSEEQVDEFAGKFEPKQFQPKPGNPTIDMAGSTSKIVSPSGQTIGEPPK